MSTEECICPNKRWIDAGVFTTIASLVGYPIWGVHGRDRTAGPENRDLRDLKLTKAGEYLLGPGMSLNIAAWLGELSDLFLSLLWHGPAESLRPLV
jgi:hypothetical protein